MKLPHVSIFCSFPNPPPILVRNKFTHPANIFMHLLERGTRTQHADRHTDTPSPPPPAVPCLVWWEDRHKTNSSVWWQQRRRHLTRDAVKYPHAAGRQLCWGIEIKVAWSFYPEPCSNPVTFPRRLWIPQSFGGLRPWGFVQLSCVTGLLLCSIAVLLALLCSDPSTLVHSPWLPLSHSLGARVREPAVKAGGGAGARETASTSVSDTPLASFATWCPARSPGSPFCVGAGVVLRPRDTPRVPRFLLSEPLQKHPLPQLLMQTDFAGWRVSTFRSTEKLAGGSEFQSVVLCKGQGPV